MPASTTEKLVEEPHVLDWAWLRDGSHRDKVAGVVRRAAPTGLFHIVNHGLDSSLVSQKYVRHLI